MNHCNRCKIISYYNYWQAQCNEYEINSKIYCCNYNYNHCCKCKINYSYIEEHCCKCQIIFHSYYVNHCCIHQVNYKKDTNCNNCTVHKKIYEYVMVELKYHPRNVAAFLEENDIEDLDNM